jgi:hypothetical protein
MKFKTQSVLTEVKRVMSLENVVGVGYGLKEVKGCCTGQPAVTVLVRQKVPESSLALNQRIPKKLARLHTDVLEVGEVTILNRQQRMRPAYGGCSIAHHRVSAGTLGALVFDRRTGDPLILSNNHVLANITNGHDGRARVGDPVLQPGRYDGGTAEDVLANLERFVPVYVLSARPTCAVAGWAERLINLVVQRLWPSYEFRVLRHSQTENLVDAAVARPIAPELVSAEILEVGTPAAPVEPELGMKVQKSGRTTGLTFGEIKVIQATLKVSMGDVGEALFNDQVVTTAIGQPGDSGSLVMDMDRRPVALLAAGSQSVTICNRIQSVISLLDVRF